MNLKTPTEVLRRLVAALPRCCSCERDVAVVMTIERFWLCEKCLLQVPCGDEPPAHDMRSAVYAAIVLLEGSPNRTA